MPARELNRTIDGKKEKVQEEKEAAKRLKEETAKKKENEEAKKKENEDVDSEKTPFLFCESNV